MKMYALFQEAFADPFEAVPAADEDKAADVLVEGEDGPHRYKSPAERNSEQVASYHLYAPHDYDSENHREIDVSGASERVYSEEIQGTAVFKEDLYP